jgi:hypothetical protein
MRYSQNSVGSCAISGRSKQRQIQPECRGLAFDVGMREMPRRERCDVREEKKWPFLRILLTVEVGRENEEE